MKPLYVLLGSFVITAVILKLTTPVPDYQLAGRISMAVMLLFTGIAHFTYSRGMEAMIPDAIPMKSTVVLGTGVLELVCAAGLLLPAVSEFSGALLMGMLVLFLPANIKAAMDRLNYETGTKTGPGPSYLWIRIPVQLLFILWVYFSVFLD